MFCPCHSQKEYSECCQPLLNAEKQAATPESLMRSRYTAFTQKNVDYLLASMTPELQLNTNQKELRSFAEKVESWIKLELIEASIISSYSTEANVEFTVYFIYNGEKQRMHENSHFIKHNGKWLYAGPIHQCSSHDHDDHYHHDSYVADVKIGRNDPCTCGSGKKYKKCCYGIAV